MSKTRALETTPYTLTITSSCEDGSGYNLYLATLNTNTLSASSIHYIITEHGNQNIVVEGMLSDASDGISDFEYYDIDQLNNGINGTYGSVYRLYSSGIQYNSEVSYDLYLYIDESVTNETMGQTFVAGVAVKASDYDFATINGVSVTEATTDSITVSVNASNGTNNITNYYYSINNGEYVSSTSNTYTFEGLDMGTTYDIKVYVVDTNGAQSNVYSTSGETSDGVYFASYITSLYTSDGANDLYYHDGSGTYGAQEAGDNSYRYSGSNPNNYVCFGSDAASCPSDNLYRIIGVFGDEVKLIKADYVQTNLLGTNGDYYSSSYSGEWGSSSYYKGSLSQSSVPIYFWNENRANTWSESQLNTVNLNTNYLNNIGSTWSSKIANHTWQVGGATSTNVYNSPVKTAHTYEVGASAANTTYQAKIGLMYVSDYGYAASPENWSTNMGTLNTATNRDNNWMFMGLSEWTISRVLTIPEEYAFIVRDAGNVHYDNVGNIYAGIGFWAVRPSFYLQPWVLYSSGDGTQENPFRISAPENLISFSIESTTYYAEDGMTWGEWIDSIYNNASYNQYCDGSYDVVVGPSASSGVVSQEGTNNRVSLSDVIENNYNYYSANNPLEPC